MNQTTTDKATKRQWHVGGGIRHHDTIGICSTWEDGNESGEETIAEVLPSMPQSVAVEQANLIVQAVNEYDSLKACAEALEAIVATCDPFQSELLTQARQALSTLNAIRNKP